MLLIDYLFIYMINYLLSDQCVCNVLRKSKIGKLVKIGKNLLSL